MDKAEENGPPLDEDNDGVSDESWSDCEDDNKADDNGEESDSNESVSGESACDIEEAGISSDDSDGGSEKCAICLQRFSGQEIGSPETCEHHFCLKCITEWSKKVATCPVDRKIFPAILVKRELFGSVTRIIDVEVGNATSTALFDEYDTDPTYCEICGHCDREDRLLLCDGCDLGYHLECLEPPMEYVPIEDWYCTTCQVQRLPQSEEATAGRPSRRQLRLPRTGQSRRILQSIRQSVRRITSSVENGTAQPTQRRVASRKSGNRKRKTTRRKGKGTGRKSKRRFRKGKLKRSRVAMQRRPSTARGRIAAQLGILPPRPGQIYVGLPRCRTPASQSAESSNSSSLRNLRYQAGITPLRIYSNSEDLADYLEQYSDDEGPVGVARAHGVHHRIGIPIKTPISSAAVGFFDAPALHSASPDVLGPILNNQIIMLTDRNIQIKRDGTLVPSISLAASSSTAIPSKPARRNSITNENSKRGYDSIGVGKGPTLKPKSPSNILHTPVNSCPSLSTVNGAVRQVPTSPNSSDSNSNTDTGNASNCYSSNSKNNVNNNNSGNQSSSSSDYNNASAWKSDNMHGVSMFGNDDPNGTKAYENYLYSSSSKSPKSNPERRKSFEPSESETKNPDDDEEYDIYSDIEEDAGQEPETVKQNENESEPPLVKEKERERDSDSDMVIDEAEVQSGQIKARQRDSRSSAESLSRTDGESHLQSLNATSASENADIGFNLPSPTSIPLPDSTPPTSPIISIDDDDDKDEDMERLSEHFISSPETDNETRYTSPNKPRAKEEYDPSQPLTSSDEEEHSSQLTRVAVSPRPTAEQRQQQSSLKKAQQQTSNKLNTVTTSKSILSHQNPAAKTIDEENDIDLNSIPMPPSEDYRRPTIQFSIPARHKLLSISSLIKRQKGVAKKENKSAMSFTSEISKAFGEEKQDESDEEEGRNDEKGGRISLVAEIFGSDDEEEKPGMAAADDQHPAENNNLSKHMSDEQQLPLQPTTETVKTPEAEVSIPGIRLANTLFEVETPSTNIAVVPISSSSRKSIENALRWKKIVDDEQSEDLEQPMIQVTEETVRESEKQDKSANIDNDAGSGSDESIAVLKTIENTKPKRRDDSDEVMVLNVLSSDKHSNEVNKKSRSGDKDKHMLESISEEDSEFERESSKGANIIRTTRRNSTNKKDKPLDRDGRNKEPEKRSTKRKRSTSPNNREEGEIIDSPGKRRKKKKEKKKAKKRRKSKDDKPVKFDFSEKKVPDAAVSAAHNSSSEENIGDNLISWRKPSNSTKERNYRDGKPKAEEKYFKARDKKRDPSPSPRDRREKHQREKSPTIEKDKSVKEKDSKRPRRRSYSPRSRSRSYSKSRNSSRRFHSRSNRSSSSTNKSFHSRSRSRSLRLSRKHGRFSISPRHSRTRSNSRTPLKPRSRSPLKRNRNRKRSLSNNRPRRFKGRKRSISSSTSTSSKRDKRKRNKDKPVGIEKVKKKKEKEKGKEKVHEVREPKEKEKEREKEKEKDKTKRKRRREKSVSPAKEIFADGDSIVVSLNFQKTPTVSSAPGSTSAAKDSSSPRGNENEREKSSKKDGRGRARTRHRRSLEKDENGKPRLLKKTLLIDLESSPVQEQNIGVSPTLIVLSDDEDGEQLHGKSKGIEGLDAKDSGNIKDGAAVTTSSCNDGHINEGSSPYRHGVAADSTQLQHPNQSDSKMDDEPFSISMCTSISPYEGSNLSPTRGDSLVTSTRDSEIGLPHDDDSRSPSSSPPSKQSDAKIMHQPRSPAGSPPQPVPPVSPPPSHLMLDTRNENISTPTSSVSSHIPNHQTNLASLPISGKPLIGNIPGLFPSSSVSASTTGNLNIPTPIVIPTPPTPQMRFASSQSASVNQGLLMPPNVLASVANALYGPLLAARQQQQQQQQLQQPQQQQNTSMLAGGKFSTPVANVGAIGNKMGQQGSVLLPKNQNSHSLTHGLGGGMGSKSNSSGRLTGDGDSPFSPNSSDGDDLFEPPLDRSQMDSTSGSNKPDKNMGSQQTSTSSLQLPPSSGGGAGGNVGGGTGKSRDKSNLFDNLFGSTPSKKPSSHPKSHDKSSKTKGGGPHQKSKTKRVAKKEIVKLSEGELRLTEDVPTSAVELRVKEKFLKKLNRQERVVEEVKLSLKPHYSKKHVTKDEYKEILRRAVPKICHNKSGEINPFKIKELVEAYVKKFRHSRKKE